MSNKRIDEFEDDQIYKSIFLTSSGIMIFLISIYFVFLSYGFDVLDFSFIENKTLSIIVCIVLQLIGAVGLNAVVYATVYKLFEIKWKKENKHMYLKGEWLTIHDKGNVRLGFVKIAQSFKTIKVEAFNVSPKVEGIKQKEKSNWEYSCASLYPQQLTGIKMLGCYISQKNCQTIMGVHQIDSIEINEEVSEYPYAMSGQFCDTVKNDGEKLINVDDNVGKIYFYKVTPELKAYLNKGTRDDQLKNILEEESLKDEMFLKKLKSIVSQYVC